MDAKLKIEIQNSNDLFTDVFYKLEASNKRFTICYGGSGSSKSYSLHQLLILRSFNDNKDVLVVRKTGSSLRNSVYKGIRERINNFNLSQFFTFVYSNDNRVITNTITGSQMIFTGLDDPEKIKSTEKIGTVYIEEANQLKRSDFNELNRRVRGIENIQFFILFNPVSVHSW